MSALLILGGVLILLGILVVAIFLLGGIVSFAKHSDSSGILIAGMGFTMMIAGALIILGVFGYGIWLERKGDKGVPMMLSPVYVVATYAVDKHSQATVPYWREYPAEELRFFVRLRFLPNRKEEEYECTQEVFQTIGDGMQGDAVVQGRWLRQFTPQLRPTQSLYGDLYGEG